MRRHQCQRGVERVQRLGPLLATVVQLAKAGDDGRRAGKRRPRRRQAAEALVLVRLLRDVERIEPERQIDVGEIRIGLADRGQVRGLRGAAQAGARYLRVSRRIASRSSLRGSTRSAWTMAT
jgi:hypothetical protein